jgi:hypothetical protein
VYINRCFDIARTTSSIHNYKVPAFDRRHAVLSAQLPLINGSVKKAKDKTTEQHRCL